MSLELTHNKWKMDNHGTNINNEGLGTLVWQSAVSHLGLYGEDPSHYK